MDWIWTSLWGLPLMIWILFVVATFNGTFLLGWIWGTWFDTIMWNEDQMTEILGEEIMRPHRSRRA